MLYEDGGGRPKPAVTSNKIWELIKEILKTKKKKNANIVRKKKVGKGSFIPYPAKELVNLMNLKLILVYSHIRKSRDMRIFLKQLRTWRLDIDAATYV